MNKQQLAKEMADISSLDKSTAVTAIEAFIEAITDALVDGDSVTLIGFGTFSVRERAARKGRNPRTGEPLDIKAANVPIFKPVKSLKDAVNDY